MRGYLTFFIVFAACLLLVALAKINTTSKYSDYSKAIWVERYYQTEMNVKEAVVEATREGVMIGTLSYAAQYANCLAVWLAEKAAGNPTLPPRLSKECLELEANKWVVTQIKNLNGKKIDDMSIAVKIDSSYDNPQICENICNDPPDTPQQQTLISLNNFDIKNLSLFVNNNNNTLVNLNRSQSSDKFNKYIENSANSSGLGIKNTIKEIIPEVTLHGGYIQITIRRDGFGDVTFNMPSAKVKIG